MFVSDVFLHSNLISSVKNCKFSRTISAITAYPTSVYTSSYKILSKNTINTATSATSHIWVLINHDDKNRSFWLKFSWCGFIQQARIFSDVCLAAPKVQHLSPDQHTLTLIRIWDMHIESLIYWFNFFVSCIYSRKKTFHNVTLIYSTIQQTCGGTQLPIPKFIFSSILAWLIRN